MAEFEIHDDRESNLEAPLTSGFFMDASGVPWANRPDQVIERYMNKVAFNKDQYWQYREYLDSREWFNLDMFLETMAKSADQDDEIRIRKSREVIANLNKRGE